MAPLHGSDEDLSRVVDRFRARLNLVREIVFCYEPSQPISLRLPIEEQVRKLMEAPLVECNGLFAERIGSPSIRGAIGRSLAELGIGSARNETQAVLARFFDQGGDLGWVIEDHSSGQDLRVYEAELRGVVQDEKLLSVWGRLFNVTEKALMRRALEEKEEHYRRIFEEAVNGFFVYSLDGELLDFNSRACRLHRVSEEEMRRMKPDQFIHQDSLPVLAQFLEAAREGREIRGEAIGIRSDGSLFEAEVFGVPHDMNGERRLLSMVVDVTERNRAERVLRRHEQELEDLVLERTRELEAAHESLIEKERMAALGRLTATVSHELRNPLGTIRGSVFTLSEKVSKNDPVIQRTLERIDRNIKRCDRIIEELLDYTKGDRLQLTQVSLDDWLHRVLDEMEPPPGHQIDWRLDSGVAVAIDSDKMHRAVVNVVNNALEAMGSTSAGKENRLPTLAIASESDGHSALIRILDNGPGILEEDLEKIFEPLFSTKSFGVGLGLPTVRKIVQAHGGEMAIQNHPEGGVQVEIRLPLIPS